MYSNFAAHLLLDLAGQWPDRIAARCQGTSLRYGELVGLALAMGGLLRGRGVAPGDNALIVLPDSFSFLASFLGCLLAGVTAAPVNNRLRREDYAACLADLDPALVIAPAGHEALDSAAAAGAPCLALSDETLPELLRGSPSIEPYPSRTEDVCVYFVTSGTTGHPKIVPHRHADFFTVATSTGDFFGYRPDDVVLCSAKMCHAYGMFASLILPFQVGAMALLDPDKPGPETTERLLVQERATIFTSVPVLYSLLLLGPADRTRFEGLRLCFAAGEALPEAVFQAWRERTGHEIWQGYGSTETMTFIIGCRPPDIVPGTAGRILEPYRAKVVDAANRPVAPGVPGHLAVQGASTMHGYYKAPEWTGKVFTNDGFLLTGDMAVEKDGLFTILGRMDDMFKVGGLWVSPTRVEGALLSHPAAAQCAVTGGTAGAFTLVRAHVVLKPGYAAGPSLEEDLRRHAAERLPDFMTPADIVFRDALPLTASGKVQRFKLRQDA